MNRPIFMFRPNLRNPEHRKAWEILQNVPEGQKNAFLVQAVLGTVQKEELEHLLRRIIREEIQAVPASAASREDKIPQEMMGFLDALLEDD